MKIDFFDSNSSVLDKYDEIYSESKKKLDLLINMKNEMTGWLTCFNDIDINELKETSSKIFTKADIIIVIGIGGSFLGTKSAVDFLHLDKSKIRFLGINLDTEYISEILFKIENKSIFLIIVSKSGNTLETSICSKILINFMEKKYKDDSKKRIIVITDKNSGNLRKLSTEKGYKSFFIPENVGGRFSFLTPAILFPLACLGVDIEKIIKGAIEFSSSRQNDELCLKYASLRNVLYKKGKTIEILSSFSIRFKSFLLWCQQLFGESEGKQNKGIFPSWAMFSTDLHSMGQFIQEGPRNLFETFIKTNVDKTFKFSNELNENIIDNSKIKPIKLPLELINSKNEYLHQINEKIFEGTLKAHIKGGVPCTVIEIDDFSEHELGKLVLFFEKSCTISSMLIGVNPFNQPGVEAYKNETRKILDLNI